MGLRIDQGVLFIMHREASAAQLVLRTQRGLPLIVSPGLPACCRLCSALFNTTGDDVQCLVTSGEAESEALAETPWPASTANNGVLLTPAQMLRDVLVAVTRL
jgi:hypothetical protein